MRDHPTSGSETRGPQRPRPREWSSQAGRSADHLTLEPQKPQGTEGLPAQDPSPGSRGSPWVLSRGPAFLNDICLAELVQSPTGSPF